MNTIMKCNVAMIVTMMLVTACTTPFSPITSKEISTNTPVVTPIRLTPTNLAMITPTPTIHPITPTSLPLPLFPLDGYVILFTKDGDLYFQDGTNSPTKLSSWDKDARYTLSDDNQKVLINAPDEYAYSRLPFIINTDGIPQEQHILGNWADQNLLWGTRLGQAEFIASTHQIIFSTHSCNSYDNPSSCVSSLFLANLEKDNDIKKLTDLGFSGPLHHENFVVSPNGKLMAVMSTTSVDILNMDGKVVHHDILAYKPNTPAIVFPILSWLPDSSGLLAGLPTTLSKSTAYNYMPAASIWRYTISSNSAVQIPFDTAPPLLQTPQFSPDGKWIVYGGLGGDPEVYLRNLEHGQIRMVGEATQASFTWAPDSKNFAVTSAGSQLGAIDRPSLIPANFFAGWVDGNHFLWVDFSGKVRVAEIKDDGLKIYDTAINGYSLFMKPK